MAANESDFLDPWAWGFVVGLLFGIVGMGLIVWAVLEPLR